MIAPLALAACLATSHAAPGTGTTAVRPKQGDPPVTISLVGDVLLGRGVTFQMHRNGMRSPFEHISSIFQRSDLVVGDLKCAVRAGDRPAPGQPYVLGIHKESLALLRAAGFTAVSLANQHSMDYRDAGLAQTVTALRASGVEVIGGGRTLQEANRPLVRLVRGRKIAFLAYALGAPSANIATTSRAGLSLSDAGPVARIIHSVRHEVDCLVVYFDWGREFQSSPDPAQIAAAHAAIDAGADVVAGSNPHVLQGVERYRGKYIFYSLGNFVFDQRRPRETAESVIVKLRVFCDRIDVVVIPVLADRNFAPRFAHHPDADRIFARLSAASRTVGSSVNFQTPRTSSQPPTPPRGPHLAANWKSL